jgi:hypothetical protein
MPCQSPRGPGLEVALKTDWSRRKQTALPSSLPSDVQFRDLILKLQSVRWRYKREMSMGAQNRRPPNLLSLYDELGGIWHTLCERAGLAAQHQPDLPAPMKRLLIAPSGNLNEAIVYLNRPVAVPVGRAWSHTGEERVTVVDDSPYLSSTHSSARTPSQAFPPINMLSPTLTASISTNTSPSFTAPPRGSNSFPQSSQLPPPKWPTHVASMYAAYTPVF